MVLPHQWCAAANDNKLLTNKLMRMRWHTRTAATAAAAAGLLCDWQPLPHALLRVLLLLPLPPRLPGPAGGGSAAEPQPAAHKARWAPGARAAGWVAPQVPVRQHVLGGDVCSQAGSTASSSST